MKISAFLPSSSFPLFAFIWVMLAFFMTGCAQLRENRNNPPEITSQNQLKKYVGKTVILKGVVSNTKLPELLGVEIDADSPDLRGEMASARGILRKRVITEKELGKEIAQRGMFANRGPGTFYRLESPDGNGLARAERIAE